jgi:hypothetical protein
MVTHFYHVPGTNPTCALSPAEILLTYKVLNDYVGLTTLAP